LSGLQNCLPEEEGRRFAELFKDTSYEEVCILEGLSMSNRIQGNRNEELGSNHERKMEAITASIHPSTSSGRTEAVAKNGMFYFCRSPYVSCYLRERFKK